MLWDEEVWQNYYVLLDYNDFCTESLILISSLFVYSTIHIIFIYFSFWMDGWMDRWIDR